MRIRFVITGPDGSPAVSGAAPTDTGDLSSWRNHGSVARLLRAAQVPPVPGQKLVMWVEDDRAAPMFPAGALDRAVEAFHDALARHLDNAAASWSRARDWVDAPVPAVVEALLWGGWVPPFDPVDEPAWDDEPAYGRSWRPRAPVPPPRATPGR